jgi:hypothetical protein
LNRLNTKHIAWLLPVAYLLHLTEEYFGGEGFYSWFSGMLNVELSSTDFIVINAFGFATTLIIVILYSLDKVGNFLIAALGSLLFVNGIIHLLASLFTVTYSPGTITGIIIYLPLGVVVFKKIFPLLPEDQRILSFIAGVSVQIIVALIAFSV